MTPQELRRRPISRREFLRRSATTAAALPLAGELLAACSRTAPDSAPAIPLARQDHPVAWPIFGENPQIGSGLPIERGATLKVYEWRDYLSKAVLDGFARRYSAYDAGYEVASFENRAEALARIGEAGADFDVFFPTIDQIGGLVAARMLRPLNHEYLPNLRNLWPQFRGGGNPFYDQGLRYTTPYTVFTTGIGWRDDLVAAADAPDALANPYDAFWNESYRGKVGVYDAYREVLGMALLRRGGSDVNTGDPAALARASGDLASMAAAVDIRLSTDGAYEGLPGGEFAIHQAWSGDMLSAPRLGKANALGTTSHLRYLWPSGGVVGCDLTAILAQGRNPVLAHAFLNHLLDVGVALLNFRWNGYQPPVEGATRAELIRPGSAGRGIVPPDLESALLSPEDFEAGRMLLALPPAADARWQQAWSRFVAAA